MIFIFLLSVLFNLFTYAIIAFDIYFIREWYLYHNDSNVDNQEYARNCLIAAIALTVLSIAGKFIIKLFMGRSTVKGEAEPVEERSKEFEDIKRPDGSTLHVEYYGPVDGQPLIMIHGWGNNCTEWFYQKKELAKHYRLIMPDLPGLGLSERPKNNDYSLIKYAEDLDVILTKVHRDNVTLWGHSIGGMIILTYLCKLKRNPKVKGIILEHTTYINPTHTCLGGSWLPAIQKPILEPLMHLTCAISPIAWVSNWMSYMNGNLLITTRLTSFAGTQTRGQLDFAARLSAKASPFVKAKGMLAMFKYDVSTLLDKVDVPALIITADKDKITKPGAHLYLQQHILGSELKTVSPGGHAAVFERHKEVTEAVRDFMSRNQVHLHDQI